MKMFLIGIFDRKAQVFISLEPTPNINVSLRQLTENINTQKESPLYKWPADYSLWLLGEWDNETGHVMPCRNEACDLANKHIIECESLKTSE